MAIETGNADFAANITYTDLRAQRFDFSRPTNIEYTYLYSYGGLRLPELRLVGIPKGTTYGTLLKEHYPYIQQVEYEGHLEALTLLESGRVDGVVDAINQLKPMLLKGLDVQLLNDQLPIQPVSIVTPKGKHSALLARLKNTRIRLTYNVYCVNRSKSINWTSVSKLCVNPWLRADSTCSVYCVLS